jgi:predicted outer membrane repeat protein
MFSKNTAVDGGGGAIYSAGDVTISGINTFSGNTAGDSGGAIYSNNDVMIFGDSTFSGNTALYGGAIGSNNDVTISGTSEFTKNTARNFGGAIYSYDNVTITASAGDIVFTGNKANNRPNAIYIDNYYNNDKTLSLAATDGNNVKFYDPIESDSSNPNLKIKINEQNDQTGTVLFDMSNNNSSDKTSAIYGDTTIYHGTFAMKGGAVYGADGNSGTFTLQNRATLNLADNARINGNVDLSGTVDITNGKLDIGGNLDFKNGSVLKMTIAENKIVADSVNINGYVEFDLSSVPNGKIENIIVSKIKTLDQTQLDSRFNLSTLLVTLQPVYSSDYKTMGLTNRSQTAEQYTTQNNFRKNQIQIAALLDGNATAKSQLDSLETREQLEELVTSLLAPELVADARHLPLNHPYFRVFNHINNLSLNYNNNYSGTLLRGQSACSSVDCHVAKTNRELWFEGYYQGGEIHNDSNAFGYKNSRAGMMVGVDQYFSNKLMSGLIFGYGNPRVYNSIGRVEADDYTFGVYSKLKISGIYANAFLGYGKQNYLLRQNQSNTNYNGDSFYASLEFFQTNQFSQQFIRLAAFCNRFPKSMVRQLQC